MRIALYVLVVVGLLYAAAAGLAHLRGESLVSEVEGLR